MQRFALATVLLVLLAAAPASAAPPPFGGLTPLGSCINPNGVGGACAVGRGFAADGYPTLAISPDGRNVYSPQDDGPGVVVVLSRDPATGAISQLPGSAGCVSNDGTDGNGGPCTPARGIQSPDGVVVSPDGRNVYVASKGLSDAVTAFARDPATGALTQLPGDTGCISNTGTPSGCADGAGLDGARGIAISPDGDSVYAAAADSNAVSVFVRQGDGGLVQQTGMLGCVNSDGSDGCATGKATGGVRDVVVSPDGGAVYAAAEFANAVDVFARDPSTGTLTQLPGAAGCIAMTSAGGCAAYTPVNNPRSVTVSPDGRDVYVAASTSQAVVTLERGVGGAATPAGCVSEDGSGGTCTDGHGIIAPNGVTVSPDGLDVYVANIHDVQGGTVTTFARDPGTGALSQLPGPAGCLTDTASGSTECQAVSSINSPDWIAASADNRHIYVISTGLSSVTAFNRELPPTCTSGTANVTFAQPLFVAVTCSDPNGDPISRAITSGPSHGKLGALNDQLGVIRYTPASGFHGADAFTFTATDGTLTSAPAAMTLSVGSDKVAPRISRAKISPSKFKLRRGTTIRFRLSEAARVTYSVQRKVRRHFTKAKRFRHREKAGTVKRRFHGRVGHKTLKPGKYRLTIVAVDPTGNRSKPRRLGFRILPAR
jgi:DNA-binding beta-propeller fold protein YncE